MGSCAHRTLAQSCHILFPGQQQPCISQVLVVSTWRVRETDRGGGFSQPLFPREIVSILAPVERVPFHSATQSRAAWMDGQDRNSAFFGNSQRMRSPSEPHPGTLHAEAEFISVMNTTGSVDTLQTVSSLSQRLYLILKGSM